MTKRNPHIKDRNTIATQARAERMREIVMILKRGEMSASDICELFNISPSGGRKYVVELLNANVIYLSHRINTRIGNQGHPVYAINPDASVVDDYLADLHLPTGRVKPGMEPALPTDPNRHIHLAKDDGPFVAKLHKDKPIVHEPMLAHFFGLVKA